MQSSPGLRPDCDNCAKALKICKWLAGKMERMAVMLDRHRAAVEELLAALTTTGWGFGAGLGMGLGSWAERGPCGNGAGLGGHGRRQLWMSMSSHY